MEKKTKLTISGTAKKSFKNIEIAKTQRKNSVVIEKQTSKFSSRGASSRPGNFKPKTNWKRTLTPAHGKTNTKQLSEKKNERA